MYRILVLALLSMGFYLPIHAECCGKRKITFGDVYRNSFYVGAYAGGNYVDAIKNKTHCIDHKMEFDCGYYVNAMMGFSFCDKWRFEQELSFRSNTAKVLVCDGRGGPCLRGYERVAAWMTNLYLDFPKVTCLLIQPYIGGGVGCAYTAIRTNRFKRLYEGHKYGFAWQGIVGFSYHLSPYWDLIADYRFFRSNLARLKSHNNNQHTFGIGVKYYFRCF